MILILTEISFCQRKDAESISTNDEFLITPWKFSIAPENRPSQKDSRLPTIIFQGLC